MADLLDAFGDDSFGDDGSFDFDDMSGSFDDSDDSGLIFEDYNDEDPIDAASDAVSSVSDSSVTSGAMTSREKKLLALKVACERCSSNLFNSDWGNVFNDWKSIDTALKKARVILAKEGYPGFFLSLVLELEEIVDTISEEGNPTLSEYKKHNKKSFLTTKQKLNKFRESSTAIMTEAENYRLNPEPYDLLDDIFDNSRATQKADDGDEDFYAKPLSYWYEEDGPISRAGKTSNEGATTGDATDGDSEEESAEEETRLAWTKERVREYVLKTVKSRGTRGYNYFSSVLLLTFLQSKVKTLSEKLQIEFYIIDCLFESSTPRNPLTGKMWKNIFYHLVVILNTLKENPSITLLQTPADLAKLNKDGDDYEPETLPAGFVYGSLVAAVGQLHDALYKSMQTLNINSPKYDSKKILESHYILLLGYAQSILNDRKLDVAMLYYRELQHIYFLKSLPVCTVATVGDVIEADDFDISMQSGEVDFNDESDEEDESDLDYTTLEEIYAEELDYYPIGAPDFEYTSELADRVNIITNTIYNSSRKRIKAWTVLYHVYFLALHGEYFVARDLLLVSHISDKIHTTQVEMQVLYNRCLAQLGIAAFKHVQIEQCHNYIYDIIAANKSRELLAQGIVPTKYMAREKTPEEEVQELQRQVPAHMHLSAELLEGILLICDMITELPSLCTITLKKKIHSKHFRKAVEFASKTPYVGPPENTKDKIILASKNLYAGDFNKCYEILSSLDNFWDNFDNGKAVLDNFVDILKPCALSAYLLSNSHHFSSVDIDSLATKYDLPVCKAKSAITKLIFTKAITGSIDQVNNCLVLEQDELTSLQKSVYNYADRLKSKAK